MTLYFTGHTEQRELREHRRRMFFLDCARLGGVQGAVFINAMRHDLSTGSIILDVACCLLTNENPAEIAPGLDALADESVKVKVTEEELELWKNLLPTACERARYGWSHPKRCEYFTDPTRSIPLSLATGTQALCSCCAGKDLAGTEFHKLYGSLPLSKLFFRAALSPLFPDKF